MAANPPGSLPRPGPLWDTWHWDTGSWVPGWDWLVPTELADPQSG